ncbi:hypothetical protein AYO45_02485 [Gammaproteobacteria bacterium SCGC AG-212-F23]|nr:hypothetical protein AYO45_02485 [Gammaproteobacteria bacterium SCGC AG-212-F23]
MTITFDKITEFNQPVFHNIKGIKPDFDEFDDLTNDPKTKAFAHRISNASQSNFRLEELHYNAIDFIFQQPSWLSTRFGDGTYPVWYGSIELETSFYETLYHWKRIYIEAPQGITTGLQQPITTLRTIFTVNCQAALLDLRNKTRKNKELIDPNPHNYPQTQKIGQRIYKEGYPGLITKSARIAKGENIVILKKEILTSPKHYNDYIYEYDLQTRKIQVKIPKSKRTILVA